MVAERFDQPEQSGMPGAQPPEGASASRGGGRARLGRLRRVLPEVLYRGQPALLLLPFMIILGRVLVGYDEFVTALLAVSVLPCMFLGQLLFWLLSWRAARRAGQRRLGPSRVPFAVYLAAGLLWPLAAGDANLKYDLPSALMRATGIGARANDMVLLAGLLVMTAAGFCALLMASVEPPADPAD